MESTVSGVEIAFAALSVITSLYAIIGCVILLIAEHNNDEPLIDLGRKIFTAGAMGIILSILSMFIPESHKAAVTHGILLAVIALGPLIVGLYRRPKQNSISKELQDWASNGDKNSK